MGPGRRIARSIPRLSVRAGSALACGFLAVSCAEIPTKPLVVVHVAGHVTDRDGAPVAGAELDFDPVDPAAQFAGLRSVLSDSVGAYAIDLFEAQYDVHIFAPRESGLPFHRIFETRVEPLHPRVDFRYDGFWVRGRVLDPTGSELGDARLTAYRSPSGESYDARFDSTGFTLLLPEGDYNVSAGPDHDGTGFPSTSAGKVPVASDTTWAITLAGDPLTGTLTGPLGVPVEGALLAASGPASCSAWTDASGAYRLYLPPGAYRLELRNPPGDETLDPLDLPYYSMNGPATYDISITWATWTATVRLSTTGEPVPGCLLWARRPGTSRVAVEDTTDPSGTVRFRVQPGRGYTIGAYSFSGQFQQKWWPTVIAGGDSTFDLLVDPPAATAAAIARRSRLQ